MDKKGQLFTITITTGIILAFALVLGVLFGGLSLFTYIISISIFKIIGAVMIILTLVIFLTGKFKLSNKIVLIILGMGLALVLAPTINDSWNVPLSIMFN